MSGAALEGQRATPLCPSLCRGERSRIQELWQSARGQARRHFLALGPSFRLGGSLNSDKLFVLRGGCHLVRRAGTSPPHENSEDTSFVVTPAQRLSVEPQEAVAAQHSKHLHRCDTTSSPQTRAFGTRPFLLPSLLPNIPLTTTFAVIHRATILPCD